MTSCYSLILPGLYVLSYLFPVLLCPIMAKYCKFLWSLLLCTFDFCFALIPDIDPSISTGRTKWLNNTRN